LRGYVATKEEHDRLVELSEQMSRHNDMAYSNDVDYPGKSPEPIVPEPLGPKFESRP
jgi:hypothetical protein